MADRFRDKVKFANGIYRTTVARFTVNGILDIAALKKHISVRPKLKLKMNSKIAKTTGKGNTVTFNIGIAALKGIVVNEVTNDFGIVTTCPGAGSCVQICYALKGLYVNYPETNTSQLRILNYLVNDTDGFFDEISILIEKEYHKAINNGDDLAIRWHDAGDFFAPEYFQYVIALANKFHNVTFYAYTKIAEVAIAALPKNFIVNWSEGANSTNNKIIKIHKQTNLVKQSLTLAREYFADLVYLANNGRPTYDSNNNIKYKPSGLATMKERISKLYGIPIGDIITNKQMMRKKQGNTPKWHVIVSPHDNDNAASRLDVISTILMYH